MINKHKNKTNYGKNSIIVLGVPRIYETLDSVNSRNSIVTGMY